MKFKLKVTVLEKKKEPSCDDVKYPIIGHVRVVWKIELRVSSCASSTLRRRLSMY